MTDSVTAILHPFTPTPTFTPTGVVLQSIDGEDCL